MDGILLQSTNHLYNSSTLVNTSIGYTLTFGGITAAPPYPNVFFGGDLDDIGIWNRALTQQEIVDLFNGGVSSTSQLNSEKTINIYPNPSKGLITIEYVGNSNFDGGSIFVEDILGRNLFHSTLSYGLTQFDLNTLLEKGIYTLKVVDLNGIIVDVRKIIIQ